MLLQKQIKQIIFDADDTLWENNIYYLKASADFFELIKSAGVSHSEVESDFDRLEIQVVKEHGYGSINFIFILETLFEKYNKSLPRPLDSGRLQEIINEFNRHPLQPPVLFNGVKETLTALSKSYKLYILTKGDYKEQSGKIRRAGLLPLFDDYFVPPEKNDQTYKQLLTKMNWNADETCMVGNSPKSDINTALRTGMHAVYIPYSNTWKLDREPIQSIDGRLITIDCFPDLLSIF